jgi:hypothetical protein
MKTNIETEGKTGTAKYIAGEVERFDQKNEISIIALTRQNIFN